MTKKIVIVSTAIISLVVLFYWESILGFYISLFNDYRPKIGNYWKKYEKAALVDSTRHELFEIEKLKSLALDEEKNYFENMIKLLENTHQVKMSKSEFLDFYNQLPEKTIKNNFPLTSFFEIYTHPEYEYTFLEKIEEKLKVIFTEKQLRTLGEEIILPFDELKKNNETIEEYEVANHSKDEKKLWKTLYQDPFLNGPLYKEKTEIDFHSLIMYINQNTSPENRIDFSYLFSWLDQIKKTYIIEEDKIYKVLFYIELNSKEYPVFLTRTIEEKNKELIEKYLLKQEYEVLKN